MPHFVSSLNKFICNHKHLRTFAYSMLESFWEWEEEDSLQSGGLKAQFCSSGMFSVI